MSRGSIDIPVISKFDPTGIKQAQGALQGFGKSLLSIGTLVAGAFAIRGIVNFGMESVLAAERAQQFNSILEQVAKTTGVFGKDVDAATDRMIKFADSHELVIGVEAELIKEAQGVLLSFKAVGKSGNEVGGVFDRATKAAFDMAAVLKTDARGSAVQLGKALENPIKGVTALAKAGTTFTDQQREQIKTLVESNRLLEAQELILTEVESQYGGAAEAAALGSEKIKLAFGQVQDALGAALAPAFERFTTYFINEVVPPLTIFFEQTFPAMLASFSTTLDNLEPVFTRLRDSIREAFNLDEETGFLESFLTTVENIGNNESFMKFLTDVIEGFAKLLPELILLVPLLIELGTELIPLLLQLLPFLIDGIEAIAVLFGQTAEALTQVAEEGFGAEKSLQNLNILAAAMQDPLKGLRDAAAGVADAFRNAFDRANEYFRLVAEKGSLNVSLKGFQPKRAGGGRVTGGMPYVVGEMGPELFMPGRGGNIVPNDRLGGGGGGPVYNITINANVADSRLGEVVVNAIRRYERTSGPVFARA
jgi:hypothetical protein